MSDTSKDIAVLLVRELEGFRREIDSFPDDQTVWQTVPGVTNAAGNLALHVAGNLQYYVGGVLGGSGYVRNREAEFGRRSGARSEIVAEINAAIAAVRAVLPGRAESGPSEMFPEPIMGKTLPMNRFLLHLCAHAAFHLGQAGYVRRIVTGNIKTSGPIPLEPLMLRAESYRSHRDRDTTS
jgi:DinB superfamily